MPKKRDVDEVIASDAVKSVHDETPGERILRLLLNDMRRVAALALIALGLILSVTLIATDKMQSQAFQLFNTIVTGALGYFFGRSEK